jgi:hypothetical protein
VLPQKPLRQWVLSLPFALRFLLATDAEALTQVLGVVYRTILACVLKKARLTRARGATGAVTLVQRFGAARNLNIHFQCSCSTVRISSGPSRRCSGASRCQARPSCRRSSRGYFGQSPRGRQCECGAPGLPGSSISVEKGRDFFRRSWAGT